MVTIIGAGFTGLGAALTSGGIVVEAAAEPGGIGASYYVRPDTTERLPRPPDDGEAYRFEIGGGHWLFGGDPGVLRLFDELAPMQRYERRASVRLRGSGLTVPYPLQQFVGMLGPELERQVERERADGITAPAAATMDGWLRRTFGPTLCEMFFFPFHERYTAGLYERIAPQDAYKSPTTDSGAKPADDRPAPAPGYNATFAYPRDGLGTLAAAFAQRADVRYGKRVVAIDHRRRALGFDDGTEAGYDRLISTLPLHETLGLAALDVDAPPDPYTSVLVLNIGAERGEACPDEHWTYEPDSASAFHRVGFYSNVDPSFLPASARADRSRVGVYVERSFVGGDAPAGEELERYADAAVTELQELAVIGRAEVVDPTWIDVAYTWSWPGSTWRDQALQRLPALGIHPVGRYGRWIFQGIADSVRDGMAAGEELARP